MPSIPKSIGPWLNPRPPWFSRVIQSLCAVALLTAISLWFLAYRAPLWLDETVSYWEINGGFGQIWSRTISGLSFPAYLYVLWVTRAILGNSEAALRLPSVIAMLAAVYVLYRIAREFFDGGTALLVCTLFCLQGDVAFAAIDARPYAFAVLATNLSIYALIRWVKEPTALHSILLGMSCAFILYFHYLYSIILMAFGLWMVWVLRGQLWSRTRQLAPAAGTFFLLIAPVLPRLRYVLERRNTYGFADRPRLVEFLWQLVPVPAGAFLGIFGAFLLLALLARQLSVPDRGMSRNLVLALLLSLVTTGTLYLASVATPMRVFVGRYLLVGVMGTVLVWGFLCSRIRPALLRALLGVSVALYVGSSTLKSPQASMHGYSWKQALEYAQFIAEPDGAPLVICSDLPQADFEPMPTERPQDSILFAPLSYYTVKVPVVPLPRALTPEAVRIGNEVLARSNQQQQRFLVLAFGPSYPTVNWFIEHSKADYDSQVLGVFSGVAVVEFQPHGAMERNSPVGSL